MKLYHGKVTKEGEGGGGMHELPYILFFFQKWASLIPTDDIGVTIVLGHTNTN